MSILKSIKGTFKNVQEDISGSLKSLTVSPEKPKVPENAFRLTSTINYDAGADFLHRNGNLWRDLYDYTEETAKTAQDVDIQIGDLFIYCDKQSEVLTRFHDEASRLPALITHLQTITDSLALVEEEYDKVEAALVHLENLCEEQEFRRNVVSHHKQLAVYKMKKEHELQRYKVQLAKDHAHKVEQVNKKKQHLLHEKQAAFDEQFAKEVDYYKKHGKPGRLPSTPDSVKKLDISEIEIEEDKDALDAFLDTPDTTTDANEISEANTTSEKDGPNEEVASDITSPSASDADLTTSLASPDSDPSQTNVASPDSGNEITSPGHDGTSAKDSNDEHTQVETDPKNIDSPAETETQTDLRVNEKEVSEEDA